MTSTSGKKVVMRWTWALRTVVRAAHALRPALPENARPLPPRPLFHHGTARR